MSFYVETQLACISALADQRAVTNPAFAKAIIKSYCSGKLAKGKSLVETGWKLDLVEQECLAMRFPDFGPEFIAVRQELGLRDSRIHPPPRSARASSSSTASAPAPRRQPASGPSAPPRPAQVGGAGVPVTRLAGTETGSEPPPQYASADPNPDAELARAIHASLISAMNVPIIREEGVVGAGAGGSATPTTTNGSSPGTGGHSPNGRTSLEDIPEPLDAYINSNSNSVRRASHSDQTTGPASPASAIPNRNSLTATARQGAYSAPVSARSSPPLRTTALPRSEDPLTLLSSFSTLLILDDSSSMAEGSLWSDTEAAVSSVVPLASTFDPAGVEIIFLNSTKRAKCASEEEVRELFRQVGGPGGATPLGTRLEEVLLDYLGKLDKERERTQKERDEQDEREAETETVAGLRSGTSSTFGDAQKLMRLNIIVITDGASLKLTSGPHHNPFTRAPTDDPESVIVAAARRLDAHYYPLNQLGIQLVQIGTDSEAREFLQTLDDGLSQSYGGLRDIVDTVPWTGGEGGGGMQRDGKLLRKILLGGVNKRIDRSG